MSHPTRKEKRGLIEKTLKCYTFQKYSHFAKEYK